MARKAPQKNQYFVYIVQCKNGSYYTGYTNNLKNRIKKHDLGQGAKYLRGKGPVKLIYVKKYGSLHSALCAEIAIKKLTRKKKEVFIDNPSKKTKSVLIKQKPGVTLSKKVAT